MAISGRRYSKKTLIFKTILYHIVAHLSNFFFNVFCTFFVPFLYLSFFHLNANEEIVFLSLFSIFKGKPVLVVHGGPGGGTDPAVRTVLNMLTPWSGIFLLFNMFMHLIVILFILFNCYFIDHA